MGRVLAVTHTSVWGLKLKKFARGVTKKRTLKWFLHEASLFAVEWDQKDRSTSHFAAAASSITHAQDSCFSESPGATGAPLLREPRST